MKIVNSLVGFGLAVVFATTVVAMPLQTVVADTQAASTVSSVYDKSSLHVKFTESSGITLENGVFISRSGVDTSALNKALASNQAAKKQKLFRASESALDSQQTVAEAISGEQITNLNTYFRVQLKPGQNSQTLSNKLKKLPYVLDAYPEPLPVRSPATPSFVSQQNHLKASPDGLGIEPVANLSGIRGDRVTIADLEYSWNTNHEDISDARASGAVVANGTPVDPWNDTNHGTAVAGILTGDHNSYGVNGIAPDAKLKLVNTNNQETGWDVANAIYVAMTHLQKGDIMLIEQQVWGPNSEYMPVEWLPAAYDAIKLATASGIVVVEAAGNGGVNLSDPMYGSKKFPMNKPDSGAIMVGAGAACGYQADRSRLSYSNYGARVNVQGYGECVVTSGYGALYWSSDNASYTYGFNGTSSASATIAGVAAALSSASEAAKGKPIKPAELKKLLISSGVAQNNSVNTGTIGPRPNLAKAVIKLDTVAPTQPGNFTITMQNGKPVLSWNASTDNVAVDYYRVMRGTAQIATTKNLTFTDVSAVSGVTYKYKIQAVDTAGKKSKASAVITVKIP